MVVKSTDMPRVPAHSDSEEPTKGNETAEGNGKGKEEDAESEYEIEEVLDAKRGVFPDGRMGYFVKWKGYGPEENSWVDEQDAVNATDLVLEYWRKANLVKKSRKSLDKKTTEKGRKSTAAGDSSEVAEVRPKKRSRKPASHESDSGIQVDQPQPAKKQRKNQSSKKSKKKVSDDPVGNMSKFMHMDDWEGLVSSVDTVERQPDETLNSGEVVMESNVVCKKRFPQTLLNFYEAHLKWKSYDDEDVE